jgi:hypothetical protein
MSQPDYLPYRSYDPSEADRAYLRVLSILHYVWGGLFGILTIVAGRRVARQRSRIFCMVVAAMNCTVFPFGTALGVFTLIMLSKNSVKMMYEQSP